MEKGKGKEVTIHNCAENALVLAAELLLPVLPGGRVLLLLLLLQVFQPRLGLLLLLLLPLLLPFQFLFFLLLRKCDHRIFKLRLSRLTSTIKASTEVKLLLPFAAVCPCSAPPAPECSVRASWVVCQIPAHPGTSRLSPGCAFKKGKVLNAKHPTIFGISGLCSELSDSIPRSL